MWFSAGMLATILSYTWLLEPGLPRTVVAVPSALVLALGLWHALRTGEWGMAPAALLPGFRATALFTVPAVLALLASGAAMGTLHERRDSLAGIALLVAWGGAQQWVLQTVVLREAQRATSRGAGLLLAAFLFAAVHLPNPFLGGDDPSPARSPGARSTTAIPTSFRSRSRTRSSPWRSCTPSRTRSPDDCASAMRT